MTPPFRKIFAEEQIPSLDDSAIICKYMKDRHFTDLLEKRALYLCRINEFEDKLEGTTSLAEWDVIENTASRQWYESNKYHSFVTCFTVDNQESPYMWKEYVGKTDGVRIMTTVGSLRRQLSQPGLPLHPHLQTPVAERVRQSFPGFTVATFDERPCDGFTLGVVAYFEDEKMDRYSEMAAGLSNTYHVFRKRKSFIEDQEYRVFLRPGSASEERAFQNGETGVLIPIVLSGLIHEVRLKPGSSNQFRQEVKALLRTAGLEHVPVEDSTLM